MRTSWGRSRTDGTRFATGMRQMPAITWHDGALYIVMNSRDQFDALWPGMFTAKENAERPAEPMYRAVAGRELRLALLLLRLRPEEIAAESGIRRRRQDGGPLQPVHSSGGRFPGALGACDLMFYTGAQFPAKYKDGAFIAFHGSWNRAPMPQDGYNVTFQPFVDGQPSGNFEVFALGFAGKDAADESR